MHLFHYAGSAATRQQLYIVTDKIAQFDTSLKGVQNHKITACFSKYIAPLIAFFSFGYFCSVNLRARATLEAQQKTLEGQLLKEGKRNMKVVVGVVAGISAVLLAGYALKNRFPLIQPTNITAVAPQSSPVASLDTTNNAVSNSVIVVPARDTKAPTESAQSDWDESIDDSDI